VAISLVEVLRQSIDELHGRMNAIEAGAVAEQRDTLTDIEQTTWDELRAEAEAKTGRLELLVSRAELDARAGELVARTGARPPADTPLASGPAFPYRTPGEYVLGYARMKHGDTAEAARFTRALADVTTAQTPGLVPPQVTGDILGEWVARRPSIDAMAKPPLPPVGMEVQRPRITQHVTVAPHAEKGPVASQAFTLDLLHIPVGSYAGGVDVSWELVNRSSPGALDVIFRDLVRIYARESDSAGYLAAFGDVAQGVAWDGTAETLATAIAAAAVEIAGNSAENVFPDTVWLGLTSYGLLAGLTDGNGRPMFPYLAPANALGTADVTGTISSVAGLRPVVDPYISGVAFMVGSSEEVEFYETPGAPVQLSVVDVGVAGYNVGVIGMWAAEAVDPLAFCRVDYPPPASREGGSGSRSSSSRSSSKAES
jgi:HK97 family phage major capsid protein